MSKEKQNNRVRIGGLWLKSNEYGKFYSGKISKKDLASAAVDEKGDIVVFIYPVKEKKNENSPGYNIFALQAEGGQKAPTAQKAPAKAAAVEPDEPDDLI